MAAPREVTVGDRTYPLPALNGFKAVRAARLVAEVAKCAPAVTDKLAQLRADYAGVNALVVTPALAKLPRFQRTVVDEQGNEHEEPLFTDADFEAAGGEVRIPQDPPVTDQIIAVFPIVFDAAEQQVVELFALLTAPNSELADADEAGTVDDYLKKNGRKLLHAATLDQLLDLAVAAAEVITEALTKDGGSALGKAMGVMQATDQEPPTAAQNSTTTAESTVDLLTEPAEPTGGAGETPFTAQHGANSESLSIE